MDLALMWSDAKVEELRRLLVDEKLSAGQAAQRMGITRNAAMGKAHRMGIPLATGNTGLKNGAVRKPKAEAHRGTNGGLASKVLHRIKHPPTLKPVPVSEPIGWVPVRLVELGPGDCRFTVGEAIGAGQMFCGAPAEDGGSWCRYHRGVVFQPDNRRPLRPPREAA